VAPVAPDGADIEQDRLVFRFCARENVFVPFVPVDGLVRSRAQVGAGGILQSIFVVVGQRNPFDERGIADDVVIATRKLDRAENESIAKDRWGRDRAD
jgi:hypothetical protein